MTNPETDRRETVEYFVQCQQPDGTWEQASSTATDLDFATERLAARRRMQPEFVYRIAQRTTTVVVGPADAAAVSVPPPAPRTDVYRLAADAVRETIAPADWDADAVSIWNAATNIAEHRLRRLAAEAQGAAEYSRALATPPSVEAAAHIRERLADEATPVAAPSPPANEPGRAVAAPRADASCVCGEPEAPSTVHRTDGPCHTDDRREAIALAIARVDAGKWGTDVPLREHPMWQAYLAYGEAVLAMLTSTRKPELRRLAARSGPVAGEQQNETPETEPGCAHCGKTIRRITGTLAEWWVHTPCGNTVCNPEQAGDSPRATPKPAAGVRQDGGQPE